MEDKGTLEYALRPFRVEWEVLEEKHGAVLGMMEIFLGRWTELRETEKYVACGCCRKERDGYHTITEPRVQL